MEKIENYIGGNLPQPLSGAYLDNFNPATGKVYALIPDSDTRDVEMAVKAAKDAFPMWSSLASEKRLNYLMAIAQKIEENLDDLALAETIDNGKPLWLSKAVDIPRASSNFKFYATAMMHDKTDCFEMGDFALNYTVRNPLE